MPTWKIITCWTLNELVCILGDSKMVQFYSAAVFFILSIFYISIILYVVFAYTCINHCMRRSKLHESVSILMKNPHLPKQLSSSDLSDLTLSYNTLVTSSSEERDGKKTFPTTFKKYSIASVTILILWFCSWLFMVLQRLFTGAFKFPVTYFTFNLLSLILHLFYLA